MGVKENIIGVLKYYDYFHYPLNADEIQKNFPDKIDLLSIRIALGELVIEKKVFHFGPFYSLHNSMQLVEDRIKGNKLATEKIGKALRLTKFISWFPFVDAAYISGSLSKNYANEKTDIDFFICTKPQKVWIARTSLHLFKKLTFLFGEQHSFCMNYFIDYNHREIEEKNIYTAIELVTLMSHKSDEMKLKSLLACNPWIKNFLPNYYDELTYANIPVSYESTFYNLIFNNFIFNYTNQVLMNITDFWWRKKWNRKLFPMEDYDLAFKTRLYVSKNHPGNYQKKVLEYYKKPIDE